MNSFFLFAQSNAGILDRIDNGALSALAIIAVVGCFVLVIVLVGCLTTTIQRIITIRESNRLILELLSRGYSAEEIEQIAYGNSKFSKKVGRFFRNARNKFRKKETATPVPPLKSGGHQVSA